MVYSFARIGAAIGMRVEDVYCFSLVPKARPFFGLQGDELLGKLSHRHRLRQRRIEQGVEEPGAPILFCPRDPATLDFDAGASNQVLDGGALRGVLENRIGTENARPRF